MILIAFIMTYNIQFRLELLNYYDVYILKTRIHIFYYFKIFSHVLSFYLRFTPMIPTTSSSHSGPNHDIKLA